MEEFKQELEKLLHKYSVDAKTQTPDFILSEFVVQYLKNLEQLQGARKRWHEGGGN